MRYKYEFEAVDGFEAGCCHDCPFSYIDWDNDCTPICVLHHRYDECPLEKVNKSIDEEKSNDCKTMKE